MSEKKQFDLIVIGAGPGGYVAAIRAAQLGMTVACIEKGKTLGGTCLNVGCIPSKALLDSSEHFYTAKTKFKNHGISVENVGLDLPQMMKRKDQVVSSLTSGIDGLFKKNKITRYLGKGSLLSSQQGIIEVQIKDDAGVVSQIQAPKVILATGSEPVELPAFKFDGKKIISSTEALCLEKVPEHLLVIGAGAIGLEMGSVWARLGAKVTVLEFMDKFLPMMDSQAAIQLQRSLTKQGLDIKLGTKCLSFETKNNRIQVLAEENGEKKSIECDVLLVCAGRKAYSQGLGLENVGIKSDERGRVVVGENFETSAKGIFALGDLIDGPMLAHKAEDEGVACVEMMKGIHTHLNYAAIPNVIYTWPEMACVGYTEEELKAAGVSYLAGTFPFMANGRAKAMAETDGLVKVLADEKTGRLLGVHIVGPRASDMIAEAVAVLEYGGRAKELGKISHSHPTLSEALKEAALAVYKEPIHL